LVTPTGIRPGAVHIARGRIAAIRARAPKGTEAVNLRGAYLAPGFIDLHLWGDPAIVSRLAARGGTTAFLTTFGPEPPGALLKRLDTFNVKRLTLNGAECLGVHLEGPFLNPRRGGALPARHMRPPRAAEVSRLARAGGVRLMTLAPELPGALEIIRRCRHYGIVASLGHSDAGADAARAAIGAGAAAVTHIFNGMRPFHHRDAGLVGTALTEPRLTAMVIADGVHVTSAALRVLLRAKSPARVALVTDNVEQAGWSLARRRGALYDRRGTLAGSCLTMMQAVRNSIALGGAALAEAVRMASAVPAQLLGDRARGRLNRGARADLVAFDAQFRVRLTVVGGRVVYVST
jgi:N-acetylglucosamine-6-phosphate deacetylase